MEKTEKWLLIVVALLLFQITRNINLTIYILILFISYIALYVVYFYESIKTKQNITLKINIFNVIFIFQSFYISLISAVYLLKEEYLLSLPRFLVTFPFIIFCTFYSKWNETLIMKIYKIYVYFIALASLSIPYQIFFGKIYFLADSSFREGLVRYASLAGSLTALGTLGGYALAILLFSENKFSKLESLLLQLIIILGMGMSLQKAAIANILICYGLTFLINHKKKVIKILIIIIFIIVLLFVFQNYLKNSLVYTYLDRIISYSFNSNSSLSANQDLLNRILNYPKKVIIYNNVRIIDLFLGIGFKCLSGIMGLSEYPMAHNNYVDMFLLGGIGFFVNYFILLLRNFLKKDNQLKKIITLLILLNMLIGAAIIYQPITCIIIMLMIIPYNSNKGQ